MHVIYAKWPITQHLWNTACRYTISCKSDKGKVGSSQLTAMQARPSNKQRILQYITYESMRRVYHVTHHMYLGWSCWHTVPQTVGGQETPSTRSSLPSGMARSDPSADKTLHVRTRRGGVGCKPKCTGTSPLAHLQLLCTPMYKGPLQAGISSIQSAPPAWNMIVCVNT